MTQRQEAASRMAFAAYMHDLGKLAERARIDVKQSDIDTHKQEYCPNFKGRWTHVHAAYTALAIDKLQDYLPTLKGVDFAPFANALSRDADNSLINAAARHHKPETFLQWIIATADRVASGFEREAFEKYNEAEDKTETGLNHYQARQLSLLEQIKVLKEGEKTKETSSASLKYRLPLKVLTPNSLFPQLRAECEGDNNEKAQAEYRHLWDGLLADVNDIPPSHRKHWTLWLDHFDSLWQIYTHVVPAATAGKTKPEVSLYDHSRTTAAIAVGLWRYHDELQHDTNLIRQKLSIKERPDWDEKKLLLVQGDFFGIQNFIFANGGESGKQAAKLLRGRSFYVSLLAECAALKILDALELPPTSLVQNAAGKFLIVAANTDSTKNKLKTVQKEINDWFLKYTYGQSSLGLAWLPASCNDFLNREKDEQGKATTGFKQLLKALFEQLEQAKLRAFDLCGQQPVSAVFGGYLDGFDNGLGVCDLNGYAPATHKEGKVSRSDLAADQIIIGQSLASTHLQRLIISNEPIGNTTNTLKIRIFGYHLRFTGKEDTSGDFGKHAANANIRRLLDISLPDMNATGWNGYAKRAINSYVPIFDAQDKIVADRYPTDERKFDIGDIKTFNHLACENKEPLLDKDGVWHGKWQGIEGLGILKGDVDNLGSIFQHGQNKPNFAKMAALSRQMNAFFAIYLPALCKEHYKNVYTVFAGGDDFFLIGSWYDLMKLANKMQEEFSHYCANNKELHFSAGLMLTKAGVPISYLAAQAEKSLEKAKARDGKNAVHCLQHTMSWNSFGKTLQACKQLNDWQQHYKLSTGFLYALLQWSDMATAEKKLPTQAIWRSQVSYRVFRHLESDKNYKHNRDLLLTHSRQLTADIGEKISSLQQGYRVAVTTHLYRYRNTSH